MRQELIDVRNSILEVRYKDALMILALSNRSFNFTAVFTYLNHICCRGLAMKPLHCPLFS
jgi:hypothetical protein